jgi:hypothetical protein
MMALSLAFIFVRPAFLRPGAPALEAAPLVNVPALVQHRSVGAASQERESLGELSRPANRARALMAPAGNAAAEAVTEITRKQECNVPGARRDEGSISAGGLAGPRHYPGDDPPRAPRRPPPPGYTPTGI